MLYDHTAALVRIFCQGNDIQGERDKSVQALKPVFFGVSSMSWEANNHKTGWYPLIGPPKKPLCNGHIVGNAAMGQLTFLVLRAIRNDFKDIIKTSIYSREELQRELQDVNQKVDNLLKDLKSGTQGRACKATCF